MADTSYRIVQCEDDSFAVEIVRVGALPQTAAAAGKVRQDKLLKRSETQLRRNRVPALASNHSDPPESWTLPQGVIAAETKVIRRSRTNPPASRNPLPVECIRFRLPQPQRAGVCAGGGGRLLLQFSGHYAQIA